MHLRFLVVSLVVLALFTGTGYSQTFNGLLDGYWSYNYNKPQIPPSMERINEYRAFDTRDRTFSLNYAELAIDYKPKDVGVRVDIGFGDTADVVHAAEPGSQELWRHVQQAYVTLSEGKYTMDFGKFVTPIGAEVIETKDNWNYTRGLLFTWAIPFYHFGARVGFAANDQLSVTGYLVNGWNNVRDNNAGKSGGIVLTYKPREDVTLVANALVGKESATTNDIRQIYDVILTYTLNEDVAFMVNYDYGLDGGSTFGAPQGPLAGLPRAHWQGVAAYAKIKLSDKLTTVSRYEWFDDHEGLMTGTKQHLQSYTATAQIPWQDAMFWAEYRRDWSNQDVFHPVVNFIGTQGIRPYQSTITLGLTYNFTKEVK